MSKKVVRDGWHTVYGFRVYVEDGKVSSGIKLDHNNSPVPAYPYRWDTSLNCWNNCSGLTLEALRAGMSRGTMTMM